jgi:hypothetical protein
VSTPAARGRQVRQSSSFTRPKAAPANREVVLADHARRREGDRAAGTDARPVHGDDAVVNRRSDPDQRPDMRRAIRALECGVRPAAQELRFEAGKVDAVVGRVGCGREINRMSRILGRHGGPFHGSWHRPRRRPDRQTFRTPATTRFSRDPVVIGLQVRQSGVGVAGAFYVFDFIIISRSSGVVVPKHYIPGRIRDGLPGKLDLAIPALCAGIGRRRMRRARTKRAVAAGKPGKGQQGTDSGDRPGGGARCECHSIEVPSQLKRCVR